MSNNKKDKEKKPFFEKKTLVAIGIAACAVVVFAVVMNFVSPKVKTEEPTVNKTVLNDAVREAKQAETPVPESVSAASNAVVKEEPKESDEKLEESKPEKPKNTKFIIPIQGAIINDYSGEELVYSETMKDWRTHNGIDIAAAVNGSVVAVADGTVEAITDNGMLGRTVIILHDNGIRSIYSNLAEGNEVQTGDEVKQGTVIGRIGTSAAEEAAEVPHLHFEVSKNEEIVNPHEYIAIDEETEE